jgi:hypothetical protein
MWGMFSTFSVAERTKTRSPYTEIEYLKKVIRSMQVLPFLFDQRAKFNPPSLEPNQDLERSPISCAVLLHTP